ncbi:MAG: TIGR04076 family protein [Defluviitaleaceae bacterium]|nr:TIGR04076 family protein [Defluviitaleaceae bacterium]
MTNWYKEAYTFKITVIYVHGDGAPGYCRNGYEPGDEFTCGYGCPGGFCSKSMAKLFPLMEAVRSGGDLSNLLMGASKYSGEFNCPDGPVTYKLEAFHNE